MKASEIVVFVLYLIFMLSIGVYFFVKNKSGGEKTYFLGGRQMGPWVTALSAGASDMSAWVLMGLPTSIYALGVGQVWISVGLAIGYTISWLVEAPRLRRFSIVAGDAITIPQYLTNRFLAKSRALQILCAVIFLVAYTVYAASSIKACGTLFNTVIGMDATAAMYLAAIIIISYTFLGGFSAVCWTDFFQGMLMLGALLIAPIFAAFMLKGHGVSEMPAGYWNAFASWKDIVSGLGWGLGYFGMPQVLVRFMSVRHSSEIKKSRIIATIWVVISLASAVCIGLVGRAALPAQFLTGPDAESIFIVLAQIMLPSFVCGLVVSGIFAATMSSSSSYLLIAGSAISQNLYKGLINKNATEAQSMFVSRVAFLFSASSLHSTKTPRSSRLSRTPGRASEPVSAR